MEFYLTNYLEWILNNESDREHIIKEIKKMNKNSVSFLLDNDIYKTLFRIISKYENTLDWSFHKTDKGWHCSSYLTFDRLSQETRGYLITFLCSRKIRYWKGK